MRVTRRTQLTYVKGAGLYECSQRMEFVLKAASRFNELLSGEERTYIEASLNAIADTGDPT